MNEMNDKDRSGLIEEIDRLKKELVEEKEKAEMNFRTNNRCYRYKNYGRGEGKGGDELSLLY